MLSSRALSGRSSSTAGRTPSLYPPLLPFSLLPPFLLLLSHCCFSIFETASGKIKVADLQSLGKLGVVAESGKSHEYKFVFAIDPHAALPKVD